jgi:hypothetical protein
MSPTPIDKLYACKSCRRPVFPRDGKLSCCGKTETVAEFESKARVVRGLPRGLGQQPLLRPRGAGLLST